MNSKVSYRNRKTPVKDKKIRKEISFFAVKSKSRNRMHSIVNQKPLTSKHSKSLSS